MQIALIFEKEAIPDSKLPVTAVAIVDGVVPGIKMQNLASTKSPAIIFDLDEKDLPRLVAEVEAVNANIRKYEPAVQNDIFAIVSLIP